MTTGNEWHTSFTLSTLAGSVALVRLQGASPTPAVMDYLDYPAMFPGRSYGCALDANRAVDSCSSMSPPATPMIRLGRRC